MNLVRREGREGGLLAMFQNAGWSFIELPGSDALGRPWGRRSKAALPACLPWRQVPSNR